MEEDEFSIFEKPSRKKEWYEDLDFMHPNDPTDDFREK